jgi:Tol biopolymer transport system component
MYDAVRLSPDATRAAIMAEDGDIWLWDFARDALTRLTFGGSVAWVPVWTPDGRQILYSSNRAGSFNLYRRNADGSGADERLTTSTNAQVPNSVTPDGATILGAEAQATTGWNVVTFTAAPREASSGSAAPLALFRSDEVVATPYREFAANISPDGRFFAYQSYESGRSEIYVRPYPGVNLGRWQVSTEGGIVPVWARNGRELFFLDASDRLMAVPVQTADGRFTQGRAARVLDTAYLGDFYSYDVSPDGQRFLVIKGSGTPNQDAAASGSIDVILHWVDGLKAQVPAR